MTKKIQIRIGTIIGIAIVILTFHVVFSVFSLNTYEDEYNKRKKLGWEHSSLVEERLRTRGSKDTYLFGMKESIGLDLKLWQEVLVSMSEYRDSIHFIDRRCGLCHSRLLDTYFQTPNYKNVMNNCYSGRLIICPNCPRQIEFKETSRIMRCDNHEINNIILITCQNLMSTKKQ